MSNYLLGIDCGCTVSKAAIFTVDGREIAVSGSKVEVISPQPGYIERDANGVWRAAAQAVRQVLAQAGIDPGAIVCVACTGHGNGLYLVDRFGRPVRHAILSTDSRARAIVDRWLAEGLDKLVRPKTMQALWPAQPNALLAWLQAHEPQSLARARWALMCKDFVRMRLTGQAAGELTDWSGTSLLDVARGEYDDGLLEAFGIQQCRSLLPRCAARNRFAALLPPRRRRRPGCGKVLRWLAGFSTSTPAHWLPESSTKTSCAWQPELGAATNTPLGSRSSAIKSS